MRYIIQYRHPKRGWHIYRTDWLWLARRKWAKVTTKGWLTGARKIRDNKHGGWVS